MINYEINNNNNINQNQQRIKQRQINTLKQAIKDIKDEPKQLIEQFIILITNILSSIPNSIKEQVREITQYEGVLLSESKIEMIQVDLLLSMSGKYRLCNVFNQYNHIVGIKMYYLNILKQI